MSEAPSSDGTPSGASATEARMFGLSRHQNYNLYIYRDLPGGNYSLMVSPQRESKTGAEEVVWDLNLFYNGVHDPAIKQDLQQINRHVDAWSSRYRGRVAALGADEIAAALREYEEIREAFERLNAFAYLTYATDTTNAEYGALQQRVTEFESEIEQKMLFFELEWLALDDNKAREILADPVLGKYRHYLEAQRRYKPYRLSEIEEKLLLEKEVTGRAAWVRLYNQIIGSLSYDFRGEWLNQSQILAKLSEPDREVRRHAADSVTQSLRQRAMEITFIFNVLTADKASDDRLRGFPNWLTSRNLDNKASEAMVDALINAVTSRYDLVARHYNLKRQILGFDTLYDYDRYAPLPIQAAERTYTWDEARDIVQHAYSAFNPLVGDIVRRFFEEKRIHAALAPTKRSGAFAHDTTPSTRPFILLNFTGKSSALKTLAHELGHGVHMFLAQQKQGLIGSDTPLTTAEMASVFGEMLVFNHLMKTETNPAARLAMLSEKIEQAFATVFRQVAMNRFEDGLHTSRRSQGELTTEQISSIWMDTQRAMFAGSVHLREQYDIWWAYVGHFIRTPGYVYAYAFGELLVFALLNLYRARGAEFTPQYIDILSAGDSDYPERILGRVGVDLTDPAFWNEGLETFRVLIEQEEQLAREVFPERVP